jgi:hypothetical protein
MLSVTIVIVPEPAVVSGLGLLFHLQLRCPEGFCQTVNYHDRTVNYHHTIVNVMFKGILSFCGII